MRLFDRYDAWFLALAGYFLLVRTWLRCICLMFDRGSAAFLVDGRFWCFGMGLNDADLMCLSLRFKGLALV